MYARSGREREKERTQEIGHRYKCSRIVSLTATLQQQAQWAKGIKQSSANGEKAAVGPVNRIYYTLSENLLIMQPAIKQQQQQQAGRASETESWEREGEGKTFLCAKWGTRSTMGMGRHTLYTHIQSRRGTARQGERERERASK